MEHEVRPIGEADLPAYAALRREMLLDSPWAFASSPDDDMPEAVLRERLAEPCHVIVGGFVRTGGGEPKLVASAGVYRADKRKAQHLAHIWGVYTSPAARGRGLGRAVTAAAIDVARGWEGVEGICLGVSERSAAARRVYESLGFVQWGVEPDATRIGCESACEVYMRLRLG